MGIYIYALNTNVRQVGDKKIAHSDLMYKISPDDKNNKFMRTCGHRIDYFEGNGLPDYFVHGKIEEGCNVFKAEKRFIAYGDTGSEFTPVKVGKMHKVKNRWTFIPLPEAKE